MKQKKDLFIRYRNNKQTMTFILGAHCSDGIVMVGDRKMSRSNGSPTYEAKIFQDIQNVVLGASGVVGLYDKFRQQIFDTVQENPNMNQMSFIGASEKIVFELNRTYIERTRGGTIELLVANGKTTIGNLQFVTANGVGEVVRRYQVIGSGEPYGEFFLKRLWKPEMTMEQVAVLGVAIIRIIEDNELDTGVGTKDNPQVWYIPDWGNVNYDELTIEQQKKFQTRELQDEELNNIVRKSNELSKSINTLFGGIKII